MDISTHRNTATKITRSHLNRFVFLFLIILLSNSKVLSQTQDPYFSNNQKIHLITQFDSLIEELDYYGLISHDKSSNLKSTKTIKKNNIQSWTFYGDKYGELDDCELHLKKSFIDFPELNILDSTKYYRAWRGNLNAHLDANLAAHEMLLILLMNLDHSETLIGYINSPNTINYISTQITNISSNLEKNKSKQNSECLKKLEILQSYLITRLDIISEERNMLYFSFHDNKVIAHSVCVSLDNDVFTGFMYNPKIKSLDTFHNKDREYTGGGEIEIFTDRLKMEIFPRLFAGRPMLSYQSFIFGAQAYTPDFQKNPFYNPEDSIFIKAHQLNPDTLIFDINDRPFASFQYIGRIKYKIHRQGWYRSSIAIKLGKMGGNNTENIQYKIHRDITTSSTNPLVWNTQIASGGRLGFSLEWNPEFMLFGENKSILSRLSKKNLKSGGMNYSIRGEFKIGTFQTSTGVSFIISNKPFELTNQLKPLVNYGSIISNLYSKRQLGIKNKLSEILTTQCRLGIKNVIYDGMLEGYGITHRIIDEEVESSKNSTKLQSGTYDLPKDVYFLEGKQVETIRYDVEFSIGVRIRKSTLFYRWVSTSPATKLPKSNTWHHWSSIGLVFTL